MLAPVKTLILPEIARDLFAVPLGRAGVVPVQGGLWWTTACLWRSHMFVEYAALSRRKRFGVTQSRDLTLPDNMVAQTALGLCRLADQA